MLGDINWAEFIIGGMATLNAFFLKQVVADQRELRKAQERQGNRLTAVETTVYGTPHRRERDTYHAEEKAS